MLDARILAERLLRANGAGREQHGQGNGGGRFDRRHRVVVVTSRQPRPSASGSCRSCHSNRPWRRARSGPLFTQPKFNAPSRHSYKMAEGPIRDRVPREDGNLHPAPQARRSRLANAVPAWPKPARSFGGRERRRIVSPRRDPCRAHSGGLRRARLARVRDRAGHELDHGIPPRRSPSVTAEVERIVLGLNDRRISKKGRQPPPKPTPKADATATFDTGGSRGRRGHIADDRKLQQAGA